MPNYNLRIGTRSFRVASTDKPVSKAIGKRLAGSTPETKVDSTGGSHSYDFGGQEISFDDLRDIKEIRESGGQVAQLMTWKALLNFGEGAEFHVEAGADDEEMPTQMVDGVEMTLEEWLETEAFPDIDLTVLDIGKDALWFPSAPGEIRENRAGDFKEFLPAEPWTMLPETNSRGEVIAWHQRVKQDGSYKTHTLPAEEIEAIILNRKSARDKTGISEVLRNRDEIQAFKENEQAIRNAIELHGFPQRHIKVGKEDGAPVRDDDLRRIRQIFNPRNSDANTAYFTGQDVDVNSLEAEQFDYEAIHEMDMRNLTTALGLPLEAGNVGSDGLGSGKPAELRFALLKLAIKANQRSFSTQFVEKVVRPVVRDYSPFKHTASISLEIDDPLEDIGEMADVISQVGDYLTNAEVRRKLDLPEPDDEEIADGYRSPADIQTPEEEQGGPFDGEGGLFSENRELSETRTLAARVDALALTYPPGGEVIDHNESDWDAFLDDLSKHGDVFQMWKGMQRHPEDGLESHDHATFVALEADSDVTDIEDVLSDYSGVHYRIDPETVGEMDRPDGWDADASEYALADGGAGEGNDYLADAPEWDRPLLEMHRKVVDPNSDPSRTLVSYAESSTPEFVLERIREAIMDGAMFSQFDEIPSDKLMSLRQEMADSLTADGGFTLDSITENLMEFEADLDRDEAERIARTESSAVLNKSRELGYEEKGDEDGRFYWTGASPGSPRQTEACEWLIEQTNPNYGGTPVPMDELKEMIDEAPEHDEDMADNLARPESFVVHPNERSTFVLAPGSA